MAAATPIVPVFLVRHARTALNADGRLRGRLDPPLDEIGRGEAVALAAALPATAVVAIVSSPLRRALDTAAAIAARYELTVSADPRLADRDYGPWAGVSEAEVVSEFGALDDAPGVEAADAVLARARAALDDAGAAALGTVVLVAHDAVNRLLLASLLAGTAQSEPIAQHTACWNVLERGGDSWRVAAVNQTADMGGLGA
jgi:probable phosphoglycerate mutase